MDPEARWSPQQALQHPFLTGQRFTGPFQPQSHPACPASPMGARHAPMRPPQASPFLYASPMAAMLATSPEVHAHAHAAALAAVQVPPHRCSHVLRARVQGPAGHARQAFSSIQGLATERVSLQEPANAQSVCGAGA